LGFQGENRSKKLMDYYGFSSSVTADVVPVFSVQSELSKSAASELAFIRASKVALSRRGSTQQCLFQFNVLNPARRQPRAGTSGSDLRSYRQNAVDRSFRMSIRFVHRDECASVRNGNSSVLNGTGIMNSWLKKTIQSKGDMYDYAVYNAMLHRLLIGSEGLIALPFGNGAERICKTGRLEHPSMAWTLITTPKPTSSVPPRKELCSL